MRTISTFVVAVLLLFQACSESGVKNEDHLQGKGPQTPALSTHEKELVSLGNDFSFRIFKKVAGDDAHKNVFVSPLSISMALGMTLNGAAGETQTGIKKTLGLQNLNLAQINHSYHSLMKKLLETDSETQVDIGNSLWTRKNFEIQQDFKDSLAAYFDARAEALDFTNGSASHIINGWVSNKTHDRIKSIVPTEIPHNLVMYLINAVYFKGQWAEPFKQKMTQRSDFYLADGSAVKVKMMHKKMRVKTYHSDEVQMARLAYSDSLFNMTILMPGDTSISVNSFVVNQLTSSKLSQWTQQLSAKKVRLRLPKFESSYQKSLNGILASMGMKVAFDSEKANFRNINAKKQLCISSVKHKANITVNENGSEAAGATSVGVSTTAITKPPPIFSVNRPFVYIIRAKAGGAILFMGVMRNPASTN